MSSLSSRLVWFMAMLYVFQRWMEVFKGVSVVISFTGSLATAGRCFGGFILYISLHCARLSKHGHWLRDLARA
jgi:hypothetical protein